jgi:2-polyprenyl-3-methyl-5-hydroxy-6-metoxy-1,4-benzoquinol methylase
MAAPGYHNRAPEHRRSDRIRGREMLDQLEIREQTDETMGAGVTEGVLPPSEVRAMFDRISPVYDVMDHAMTAGLDRRWRRLAAETVVRPGDAVLDACCGTGDLAIAAQRAGGRVTGLDFSEQMLVRARGKSDSVEWVLGDVTRFRSTMRASTRSPSASESATSPTSRPVSRSSRGWSGRAAASRASRSPVQRGC